MDAAGIDVAVLFHTIGGMEGIPDPAVVVSTARRINDFLAAEAAGGGRFARRRAAGRRNCRSTWAGWTRCAAWPTPPTRC